MAKYKESDDLKVIGGSTIVWLRPPVTQYATETGTSKPAAPQVASADASGPTAASAAAEHEGAAQKSAAQQTAPGAAAAAEAPTETKDRVAAQKAAAKQAATGVPMVGAVDGSLLFDAHFEDHRDLQQGGAVWLQARGVNFDGRDVQLVLEKENEKGEWVSEGEAVTTVRGGVVRSVVATAAEAAPAPSPAPPEPQVAASNVSDARFEDESDLAREGPVWLLAKAAGLEGKLVQVVVEREETPGEWVSVGEATSTVRAGNVRAPVNVTSKE